jgi:hypothetical protein
MLPIIPFVVVPLGGWAIKKLLENKNNQKENYEKKEQQHKLEEINTYIKNQVYRFKRKYKCDISFKNEDNCQVQSKNAPECSAKVHHLVTPIC